MLVKAKVWIQETFEIGSRPDVRTVKSWVESGKLDGKIIAGATFVERIQPIMNTDQAPKAPKKPKSKIPAHIRAQWNI